MKALSKQTLSINIPQLPLTKADPNLLKKLFQHLLTNAINTRSVELAITCAASRLNPPRNTDNFISESRSDSFSSAHE